MGFVLSSKRNRIFAVIVFITAGGICLSSIIIGALAISDANKAIYILSRGLLTNASSASLVLLYSPGNLAIDIYFLFTAGIVLLIHGGLFLFIWLGSFVYILEYDINKLSQGEIEFY